MENLIGRKAKGFKFDDSNYVPRNMDSYIGEVGIIENIICNKKLVVIRYENGDFYSYPADQIEAHLVEEENEIQTFTKEDLRVAYKAGFNLVKPNKECDGHFERWYQKKYEPTKEEQLTAILGSSEKVSEIMELFNDKK